MHTALSERRTEKTRTLFKICSKRQARVLLAGKKEEEEKEGGEPLYFLRHLTATRGGQRERHRKSSIKTGSFPLFPPTRYKSNICLCDPSSSSSDTLRQHNSAPGEEGGLSDYSISNKIGGRDCKGENTIRRPCFVQ